SWANNIAGIAPKIVNIPFLILIFFYKSLWDRKTQWVLSSFSIITNVYLGWFVTATEQLPAATGTTSTQAASAKPAKSTTVAKAAASPSETAASAAVSSHSA